MTKLTLEQEFRVRSFEQEVKEYSHERAIAELVFIYQQMLYQQNSYQELLKHQWGFADISYTPAKKPP